MKQKAISSLLRRLFRLKFDKLYDMSEEDFKTIKWLPFDQRVQQSFKCHSFQCQ